MYLGDLKDRNMNNQEKNLLVEFLIVVIAGACIYCSNILISSIDSIYKYEIELWNYGEQSLHLLYPIVFTIPFCWEFFYEKRGCYWKSLFNRINLNQYIRKRVLRSILLSMSAMLIVSVVSLLFAYYIGPGDFAGYEPIVSNDFLGWWQLKYPVVYAAALSCWRALLAGLYTALAMEITLICNNVFVAMTGAFVYSIVENFITAHLNVPELSICTSYYPNRLESSKISFGKLAAGPFVIVVAIVLLHGYYRLKIKKMLMD